MVNRYISVMLVSALYRHIHGEMSLTGFYTEFYAWRLEDCPEFATYVGDPRHNDRLRSFNYTRNSDRYLIAQDFREDLLRIKEDDLSRQDQLNYKIMLDGLDTYMQGYRWSRFGSLNPVNFLEGNHIDPVHHVEATPFFTRGDYENFISRLENTPQQLQEYIELYKLAMTINRTSHNVSVSRVPAQIEQQLVSPERSPYYTPFTDSLDYLTLTNSTRDNIRQRARSVISTVLDSFRDLKTFLVQDYLPSTRAGWGVGSLDHGQEFYRACLKWHLSSDFTPEVVHDIGLREVDRIVKLMNQILSKQNFTGNIPEYFGMLRDDPTLHMQSEEELLEGYRKIIHERLIPKLPQVFNNIPNLPVKVEPMPNDGPGGQYIPGSEDGQRPGVFQVNLHRPTEIGTYMMAPITLHETVPGHHLQMSYAMKAKLPDFRKHAEFSRYYEVPFHFPIYTAYVEGWALYAESLGEEMGLYGNDLELMGRYSSEIFRACRLVVDTGIHYYGWEREDALQYLLRHTPFTRAEMSSEIDRYITWPGQACAYKMGEIEIKAMRRKAEESLGADFDIREFHTVILENGPMPLSLLWEVVEKWIQEYPLKHDDSPCSAKSSINTPLHILFFIGLLAVLNFG